MKILLIDNYDSFTYNLVHYLEAENAEVDVVLNDEINFESISKYDKVVLSPGPGLPEDAGQMDLLIKEFYNKMPILGVCLGFQAIYKFFGGELYNLHSVKHGVSVSSQLNTDAVLFKDMPSSIKVGLYHSWAASIESKPKNFIVTAISEDNVMMAFEHSLLPIYGVQFHPESILTESGLQIIKNFLEA